MKQNAQTNQTKPTNKSNETQTNPRRNAHTRHNWVRDRKRKRECERERKRGSRRWRWQSVLGATVASMKGGGGGVVLRVIESEGLFESLVLGVIDLSLVVRVSWDFFQFRVFLVVERFWPIEVFFFFFWFIYTKPKAVFYKTQLRMNWSCV